jgi:hypothetical protein
MASSASATPSAQTGAVAYAASPTAPLGRTFSILLHLANRAFVIHPRAPRYISNMRATAVVPLDVNATIAGARILSASSTTAACSGVSGGVIDLLLNDAYERTMLMLLRSSDDSVHHLDGLNRICAGGCLTRTHNHIRAIINCDWRADLRRRRSKCN